MTLAAFRLTFVLACLALWTGPARAESLSIAGCTDYAPYSDAGLPDDGFSNDLTARIMREAGYDVSVSVLPWLRALEETEAGQFDILPTAWRSEARARALLFSEPIAMSRLVFVKRTGSPFEFRSLGDLKGLTVGIVTGYAYDPAFLSSPLFQRTTVPNILLNLRMVAAGHIDLTLDDELTLRFIMNTRAPELASQLALTRSVLTEQPLYVAFSRKRPDAERLVTAFNAGLARMRADGRYQQLLAKHRME